MNRPEIADGMMVANESKNRGIFFTTMLIVEVFLIIAGFMNLGFKGYVYEPSWMKKYDLVFTLVSLGILLAIIFWKKWGVYFLVIHVIIGTLVTVFFYPEALNHGIIPTIIYISLFLWAVKSRWKYFN